MKNVNYNKIAKKVIETEINSLKKLKLNLNKSFDRAVKTILGCKNGKIVISGVGKSGIIGKKISSTLSSVGTPSFFVDASSCSHGDLGQIVLYDVLILIVTVEIFGTKKYYSICKEKQNFIDRNCVKKNHFI